MRSTTDTIFFMGLDQLLGMLSQAPLIACAASAPLATRSRVRGDSFVTETNPWGEVLKSHRFAADPILAAV